MGAGRVYSRFGACISVCRAGGQAPVYLLFGYYPILKAVFDRRKSRALEWILKLAVFNAAIITVYFVLARAFGVSVEEFGEFGKYSEYIFLLLGNAVFVFYDIAVSRMAAVYMNMLHPRVQRILRGK